MRTEKYLAAIALVVLVAACAPAAEESAPTDNIVSGVGTQIYAENFDRGEPWGAGTGSSCERSYDAGRLVVKNVSADGTCELNLWLIGPLAPRVRIELTAGYVAGREADDFGLKFGYKPLPEAGFHTFTINADGAYSLAAYDGKGTWENISGWRPDPFVYSGARRENKLALEIRGREVRYFSNGAQLGRIDLEYEAEGYMGLFLNGPGLTARFDEIRVVSLPVAGAQ